MRRRRKTSTSPKRTKVSQGPEVEKKRKTGTSRERGPDKNKGIGTERGPKIVKNLNRGTILGRRRTIRKKKRKNSMKSSLFCP